MKEEQIERINELARKAKSTGLTEKEKEEQSKLRKEYISAVKSNLTFQLDRSYYIDSKGEERKIERKKKHGRK